MNPGGKVALLVNHTERQIEADPDLSLLEALRDRLDLKGSRYGCGAGQCGACFVMVSGHPLPACDTPLWAVAGKSVITVEGLGSPAAPHPLQEAFIAEQAAQCGYCTSGMLISAAALLRRNPHPAEHEVRAALERNLCRCGSHNRIVRAVLRAADGGGQP